VTKKKIKNLISSIRRTHVKREYEKLVCISEKDKLDQFIEQNLKKILLHAYNHCPYYNQIFDQIGIIQDDQVNLSLFNEIPLLTKDIMRKHHSDLISDDVNTRESFSNSSGGSTGEPVRLIQDRQYLNWNQATFLYYYGEILGIDEPNVKKVIVWGSERDLFRGSIGLKGKFNNWYNNSIFLNSFKLAPNDIEKYLSIINNYKPYLIRGYAGSLYEISLFAERNHLEVFSPEVIVSAAETLHTDMREQIEKVFRKKVFNFYGSREVSCLAGECSHGALHSFQFWNYQELLDLNNNPVSFGEEGRVIVTNLFNYSMPLIRYEIGDMAVLGNTHCPCGNILPTYEKITGRITDHFVKKDGTIIHGEYFTHLFYFIDEIEKFQVIQEDYNLIRIEVVVNGELPVICQQDITEKIKLIMGLECEIIWDYVDEIPKTATGKYIYTQSLVRRD